MIEQKRRDMARGEAKSKIHWGADVEEVLERLRTTHGIEGDEADAIIAEALSQRRSTIRKRAALTLVVAVVCFSMPVAYFAIQGGVGFAVIGFGPILMALLALASLSVGGRSLYRIITGEASGPA
jgi:hypothetical protein